MFILRQSVKYFGRLDDEYCSSRPKPLPADFYSEQAVSVQDSVGAGADIDVNIISKIQVDDECETDSSRIDNAKVQFNDTSAFRDDIEDSKCQQATQSSRIDEVQIRSDEDTNTNEQADKARLQVDSSQIDEATSTLKELEAQIEPSAISTPSVHDDSSVHLHGIDHAQAVGNQDGTEIQKKGTNRQQYTNAYIYTHIIKSRDC